MIPGIVAGQVMPHRWSGVSPLSGGSGLLSGGNLPIATATALMAGSGGLVSSIINVDVRAMFAGAGSLIARLNYRDMRATFAGTGATIAWRGLLTLQSSALFVAAGNFSAVSIPPPQIFQGSASLAGSGQFVITFSAYDLFANRALNAGSALTGSDATNYRDLLDGLTSDGLLNADGSSSTIDALYILAAPNTTIARLNLVSSSFGLSVTGSPTFVAYQGYTGVAGSASNYLGTGYTPSTAARNMTQNNAHVSAWCNNDVAVSSGVCIGAATNSPASQIGILSRFTDNKAYWRINDGAASSAGITVADTIGHYLASRSGASAQKGYKNAIDMGVVSVSSGTLTNRELAILNYNNNSVFNQGYGGQVSAVSIGANLTAAQTQALYNRLAIYRSAVGLSGNKLPGTTAVAGAGSLSANGTIV